MNMLHDTFQADDATVGSAKLREDLYDGGEPGAAVQHVVVSDDAEA